MSDQSKHSPLHDQHLALGAKMVDFGGWLMPLQYTDGVLAEHAAVREAVGVFDVSHLGKVHLSGPGAATYLNSTLTNDLNRIGPGRAQYTMLCESSGGVVDDLIVYLRSDVDVLVIPNAANAAEVVRILTDNAPDEVVVKDQHEMSGVLAVQGPRARDVLLGVGLTADLDYMQFAESTWNGAAVVVCRTGYTGELGFELVAPWALVPSLWDALVAAASANGGRPVGLGARDTLRTEMGYPLHGQDLSLDISPVQARLGWAVGWDKPSFAGREALVEQKRAAASSRLWGLRAVAGGIPRPTMSVNDSSGEAVGRVTSGTFSPTLRCGIALALLSRSIEDGDTVYVDVRGRASAMVVQKPPFVPVSTR